ncbi:response regulator [Winogradskyella sp.]|nr:response regulator [Winogradskyella sp.]MDC0007162.1 response regulator [Winogradskyella sp.]MDC1504542.1 response regulator [Winogradskyella sp.]
MSKIDIACIIDDDPIFIFGAKRMMELADFCESFMIFKNGREALNALAPLLISGNDIPEVILLDINMPIMDGWQFLDEFTQIETHKLITIYIVSSSIDPADMNRVDDYKSVTNYIIKPISMEVLRQIMLEMDYK